LLFTVIYIISLASIPSDLAGQSTTKLVKFSNGLSIDTAFVRTTTTVESILETANFSQLRRACVQRINTLGSTLPKKLVPKIKRTSTLDQLLDLLTQSEYWNWFDTRLFEALTYATGSPEAIEWLEDFKETYYSRKISELIPCVLVRPLNSLIQIEEKFDKDPKDLTVFDLLHHKYKLERDVLDIDRGELILMCIKTGCVELTWLIPPELVFRAYASMKKKCDQFSSLLIKSLVCKQADEYADLPILWRGQEVGEIGPIEPLPEHVRQEPYSLPQGFHWAALSHNDAKEVIEFLNINDNVSTNSTMFHYFTSHPHTRNEWQFGMRTTNGKLVGIVLALPVCMSIGGVSLTLLYPKIICHVKYKGNSRLFYVLCKELMRRANLCEVNQMLLGFKYNALKPVTMITTWSCLVFHPAEYLLFSPSKTLGWRNIASKDIPSALALVNNHASQFEIGQFLTSEEEFRHYFLGQFAPKFIYTYVVEFEDSITDLVSYRLLYSNGKPSRAVVTALVSTRTPVEDLIKNTTICAKNNGVISLSVSQQDLQIDTLLSLSFSKESPMQRCLYNYKYPEISQTQFWYID